MTSFPAGFLWGCGTSAYQVEGHNVDADWSDWERVPGHIADGSDASVACDWWAGAAYRLDFDLARSLGLNAFRISVEWSRVEPRQGHWDEDALSYYRRVLLALRERGLAPLVTLHHFTNPRWFTLAGGWESQRAASWFARYVKTVADALGELCDFWITINEPVVYAYFGYVDGVWPPGRRSFRRGFGVLANLVRGHAAAYHALHALQPSARVGVAHHFRRFLPATRGARLDGAAARVRDYMMNRLFFLATVDGRLRFPLSLGSRVRGAAGSQDFIGVNYYYSERTAFASRSPGQLFTRTQPPAWRADVPSFAGDVRPASLYEVVAGLRQYQLPIYVTENGLFDLGDETQSRFLVSHVAALARAAAEGVPVRGYFWWTLVDNFEWAEGYTARFGLFANDRASQRRTPRPSAAVYERLVRAQGVDADLARASGWSARR